MFAIKDLESVKNLASIMAIPFFSAAFITDRLVDILQNSAMAYLLALKWVPATIGCWSIVFLVIAFLCTLLLAGVDFGIVWISLRIEYSLAIFGFAFLTAGLFALSFAIPELPKSPLNPFWHFGFLCYGFSLFSRVKD